MKRTGGPAGQQPAPGPTEPVTRITSASAPLADDQAHRTHIYLLQMGIRVVCFIGAVAIDHWARWIMLAGAVVLPYIAVLLANAGRAGESDPGTYLESPSLPGRPQDPTPRPQDPAPERAPEQGDRP